jgi:hypothetical protein
LASVAASCASDDDSGGTASEDAEEGGTDGATEAGEDEATGGGLGLPTGDPIQAGRSIIATAEVTIEVADSRAAAASATEATGAAGGFLAEQEARPADGVTTLTLRVPTDRFQDVLGELEELGKVLAQSIDTDDVTEQVVDLESRITSARRSVERVRELLDGSGDVVQLAAVERELAQREAGLESLLGSQRVLDDQVALATIRLDLRQPEAVVEPDDDDALPGFLGGLEGGWDGFVTTASVLVTALGYGLPFLVTGALGGAVWLGVRRRRDGVATAAAE